METCKRSHHIRQGLAIVGIFFSQIAVAAPTLQDLTKAIITVESSCRSEATNHANGKSVKITSYGIGQITLATAQHVCGLQTVEQLYDKQTNLKCTKLIVQRLHRMYGDYELVIAAYNLGMPCQCDGIQYKYPNGKVCGKFCEHQGSHRNAEYIRKVTDVLATKKFCKL